MSAVSATEITPQPLRLQPGPGDALIVVDLQNDFLPGGKLPVRGGDEIIPVLNRTIIEFDRLGLAVYASRDWHPSDHCSFSIEGGPWPPHCIAGLRGAEAPAALRLPERTHVVFKGTARYADAYSAFQATGLGVELRRKGCRRVFIGGLATDYCVRATAMDALRNGLDAVVFEDIVRPVESHQGDGARALEEMRAAGVTLCNSDRLSG
ncbi:MAG: nicotinamidase [Steroidobacteraceae bacterium]